ncbi:MAG: rod shape-determining protein RodA [Bacteroidales bacterium]|nr:rod shape-determining protein RodA [Bacteroidales bacterium]MCF8389379.1 rod shape-determining protein RodA [Bacteroidales bacterium]
MKRGNILANLDWATVLLYLIMVVLGWLNIYSATFSERSAELFDFSQRHGKQFLWILAAIIIAIAILIIDHKFYDFFAYGFYSLAIILLLLVLIIGKEINGAQSWIIIGGVQIQPSELAKPAVAIALARYLSGYNLKIDQLKTYITAGIIIFTPALLILLQPDTGSALVFFVFILVAFREGFSVSLLLILIALIVLFLLSLIFEKIILLTIILSLGVLILGLITKNYKRVILTILILVGSFLLIFGVNFLSGWGQSMIRIMILSLTVSAFVFLILVFSYRLRKSAFILGFTTIAIFYVFAVDFVFENVLDPYQQRRINIVLGLESDPQGAGYNLAQSKIAIGSGGFFGKGFLNGTQTKLNFVPEQSTDFIFCTVGEEWGFAGSVVVILLFVALLLRLVQLAERQRYKFARIYGYGVFSVLFFHFFVNIAMTIGLFPVVGIPLPFFSYGGSSLWAFTILLFIFLKLDASRMEHIN